MHFHRPSSVISYLWPLLVALALAHAGLAVWAMRDKSTTSDELAHVTGGYTFNRWNDYRMHPENGLLPQRLQALPATLAGATYPELTSPNWRESDVWMTGHRFFYELGNDPAWLLASARTMNALFGLATVLLVAVWAWHLFGPAGALSAVFFCALSPTMLAHTALATSDMAMCFFLLASVTTYWWHLHDPRWRITVLSAIVFALACVAKFTSVLLLPLFVLMALLRSAQGRPLVLGGRSWSSPGSRLWAIGLSTLGHGLVAVAIIWAFCGFRYSAFNPALPPGEFNLSWDYVLSFGGAKARIVDFCRTWKLLPEGFLYGFMFVLKHTEARGAFLDGQYSIFGWVDFFPRTFLYKTPPSLLVGLAASTAGLILWARERGLKAVLVQANRVTPLLLLFVVYWAFSLTSHLNIGHRHILPTYPVLFIFTGAIGWMVARSWRHSRVGGLVMLSIALVLGGWQITELRAIHPHYLAYFSPVAGGPARGYQHLVDSSLDWGQDLPGLKHWLDENHRDKEPVYLSYFGTGEPDIYPINAIRMPMIYSFNRTRPWYWLEPGLYAISATMLQHVYMPIRGPWTPALEQRYQKFRDNDGVFREIKDNLHSGQAQLHGATPEQWSYAWTQFEELRFARLCHYLRARQPDAMIGYSILVFRLSQAELDAALNRPASELAAAIARSMQSSP